MIARQRLGTSYTQPTSVASTPPSRGPALYTISLFVRMLLCLELGRRNIGTAYLRIDVLPPEAQPALRESFKRYLDNRIETYRKIPDVTAVRASLARGNELQLEIWRQAVAAVRTEGPCRRPRCQGGRRVGL
jgi:hypothetical protein